MKTKKERYFAEITKLDNNNYKVVFANQLVQVNQYKRKWKKINAREFARDLNTSQLVIK